MKRSINWVSIFVGIGIAVGVPLNACIQTMRMEIPRDPAQLPADIFQLHVHVKPESLLIETPRLDGTTVTAKGAKEVVDPQAEFQEVIRRYEKDSASKNSFIDRNDYAASLLFAGRYADAADILVQLEKDFPGKYATASNLGTAYELIGDLDKASEWIKRGIERNFDSHQGTEWLHLAILGAKKKLKEDPAWLEKHSVMEGQPERPKADIERALEYQLN